MLKVFFHIGGTGLAVDDGSIFFYFRHLARRDGHSGTGGGTAAAVETGDDGRRGCRREGRVAEQRAKSDGRAELPDFW